MFSVLIALSALATGPYAGIRPLSVEVLGEPVYLAPDAGWAAPVDDGGGGRVRVFVGRADQDAAAWLDAQRLGAGRLPVFPFAAQAWGNGHSTMLFREANIAVLVERPGGGALDLAERLYAALDERGGPWPEPPVLAYDGRVAEVGGDWAWVAFKAAPVTDPDSFLPTPIRIIPLGGGRAEVGAPTQRLTVTVWDAYGRFAEVVWTAP